MLFEIPGTFATGIPGNLITENTWQTAIGNPANAAGNPWNIFCWKSITQMLMKIPGTNADGNPWSKCWWKSLEQMLMEIHPCIDHVSLCLPFPLLMNNVYILSCLLSYTVVVHSGLLYNTANFKGEGLPFSFKWRTVLCSTGYNWYQHFLNNIKIFINTVKTSL